MGGYFDRERGRYVSGVEAAGDQRPFDRGRRDRQAFARELVELGEDAPSFAEVADSKRSPVKDAARAMFAMAEYGADPQAISARLAEDRELPDENEIDSPEINTELVGSLADEADDRVREIRAEREAAEIEQAFDSWLEQTFDVEQLRAAIADMDTDEAQEAIEAVADRFTEETGLDGSSLIGLEDEFGPGHEPFSFQDDGNVDAGGQGA